MNESIDNFKMPVILGRTGIEVGRLGIASGFGAPAAAFEKAYHEYGINYFLWATPRNSKMKEALKNLAGSQRDNMVIALQSYDHSGILIPYSVNKGLKTLNIEYADVLLLGWYSYFPKRVIDIALDLKEKGKIRFIAMSGHNREFFGKLAADPHSPIDILMIRYNAVHRGAEKDIFPFLTVKNRPGITIYTATCRRKLLNAKNMPPDEQPLTAAECYRFVLSNPNVDLCLSGPASIEQMVEGMAALDQGPLSTEEMKRIKRIGDFIHK